MLYTERSAKDAIRNRQGQRVFYLAQGDQLTPAAREFLRREKIEILPAQLAKPEQYRLLSGGVALEKPEHMTHLDAQILVPKTHRRIAFRGKMDSLQSELLLCQLHVRPPLVSKLEEALTLCRNVIRCDVLQEDLPEQELGGLSQQELRSRSHDPQRLYGQPHFMPEVTDGAAIVYLNRCRCAAREAERLCLEAFSDREGLPTRPDLLQAMNRLSSYLYLLMIEEKAREDPHG